MLVSPATLDRWFTLASDRDRPSYAQHLRRRLAADELAGVEALFRQQLGGQPVPWRTRTVFVLGQI
jgi:hypothetical protein